jgi:hypothetical protein
MANKQDSNLTGLRYAEEASLKVLPGSPVWYPLEPNTYSNFGGQISTIARNPINATRQRKKGVTTDLDASGGFNQDLTFSNTTRLLQGFFFADIEEKLTNNPTNGTQHPITAVAASGHTYTAAAGLSGLLSGDLMFASGFAQTNNNGLKHVTGASTGTTITVTDTLTDETPAATAKVKRVGHRFGSATSAIVMNGSLVQLTESTTDLTTIGLIPGEWVFVGGDAANTAFVNNIGFARVSRITAGLLEFDKVSWTPQAEAGTGKTIEIYFGDLLRNQPDPNNIKRRTYQIERQLGNDGVGVMSEYLVGAVANELKVNIAQADKVTIDLSFVAVDNEQRTGTTGVKSGTRPTLVATDAFNTSSDFYRIKLASVGSNASVSPLFAFATDLNIDLKNNVTANKAVGVLGAFDTSAGTFEVGGSLTAYFADVSGVQAVRTNADITLDFVLVKNNTGLLFDIPLLALGNGRLDVKQDQAITLPLDTNAAQSSYGWTLTFQSFEYLPALA